MINKLMIPLFNPSAVVSTAMKVISEDGKHLPVKQKFTKYIGLIYYGILISL